MEFLLHRTGGQQLIKPKDIGFAMAFIAIMSIAIYVDYWLWSAEHPGAPLWTFFISGK